MSESHRSVFFVVVFSKKLLSPARDAAGEVRRHVSEETGAGPATVEVTKMPAQPRGT